MRTVSFPSFTQRCVQTDKVVVVVDWEMSTVSIEKKIVAHPTAATKSGQLRVTGAFSHLWCRSQNNIVGKFLNDTKWPQLSYYYYDLSFKNLWLKNLSYKTRKPAKRQSAVNSTTMSKYNDLHVTLSTSFHINVFIYMVTNSSWAERTNKSILPSWLYLEISLLCFSSISWCLLLIICFCIHSKYKKTTDYASSICLLTPVEWKTTITDF